MRVEGVAVQGAQGSAHCWHFAPPPVRSGHLLGPALLVMLPTAIFAAGFGLWFILPFMGLEIVAILWVLQALRRRASDFERVILKSGALIFERGCAGITTRRCFLLEWIAVDFGPCDGLPGAPLVISGHGQRVRWGRWLGEREAELWLREYRQLARRR